MALVRAQFTNFTNSKKNVPLNKPIPSDNPNKKWMVFVKNPDTGKVNTVRFGDPDYEDYLEHQDPERRKRFRAREAGIKLKDGSRAIDNPLQPAYWAYNYSW